MTLTPQAFAAELAALSERLDVYFQPTSKQRPPLHTAWQKTFGDISPAQLFTHFKRAIGDEPPFHLGITFSQPGNEAHLYAYQLWDLQKMQIREETLQQAHHILPITAVSQEERIHNLLMHNAFLKSPCHMSAMVMPGEKLHVNTAEFKEQGAGRARSYLRAYDALAATLNLPTLTLFAQEVGGYAWAKYGFTPASQDVWTMLKQASIGTKVKDGKLVMGNQKISLSGDTQKVLARIERASYAKMPEAMNALLELREPIRLANGSTQTLAQCLLLHTKWAGELKRDPKDLGYQRFQTYAGIGQQHGVAA